MPKVELDLSEGLYKSLEKLSLIKGAPIETLIIDFIKDTVAKLRDIDAYYEFKHSREIEVISKIREAVRNKKIRIRNVDDTEKLLTRYVRPLGRFITLIMEVKGGKLPHEVRLSELRTEDAMRVARKLVGVRIWDYDKWLLKQVQRIKTVAPAFGMSITKVDNDYVIRFANPAVLEGLYGIGARARRRKLRVK